MAKDFMTELIARIESIGDEYAKSKECKDRAEEIAQQVRKRTRLGKGVSDSGDQVALAKLSSDSYKDLRKKFKDSLSPETSPGKSNLTATGQLLDSIESKVQNESIIIFFNKSRGAGLDGRFSKITNDKLARYVQEQGRRFFDLTKSELNRFTRLIRGDIIKLLKKK